MIVVDTNIIAHFYLPSDHTELCEKLFQWDPDWVVPILWKSEFRNVVLLYIRNKFIELPDALQITEKAENQMNEREAAIRLFANYINFIVKRCFCVYVFVTETINIQPFSFNKKKAARFRTAFLFYPTNLKLNHFKSNRSKFITLSQAEIKSLTNFTSASSAP